MTMCICGIMWDFFKEFCTAKKRSGHRVRTWKFTYRLVIPSVGAKRGDGCPVHKTPFAGIEPTHKQLPAPLCPMEISCLSVPFSDPSSFHRRCGNRMAIHLGYSAGGPIFPTRTVPACPLLRLPCGGVHHRVTKWHLESFAFTFDFLTQAPKSGTNCFGLMVWPC